MGMFALRPVHVPARGHIITLEFCWLKHSWARPTNLRDVRTGQPLSSGHKVTITTLDPVDIPLPPRIIFDMQWKLRRAVALENTLLFDPLYAKCRYMLDNDFPLGVESDSEGEEMDVDEFNDTEFEHHMQLEVTSSDSSLDDEPLFDGPSEGYETDDADCEDMLEFNPARTGFKDDDLDS